MKSEVDEEEQVGCGERSYCDEQDVSGKKMPILCGMPPKIDRSVTYAFADGDPLNIPTKISKNSEYGGFMKPPFSLNPKIDMNHARK